MLLRIVALALAVSGLALLDARNARSFEFADSMWRVMPVTYCVNPSGAPVDAAGVPIISDEAFLQQVQAAFQRWQDLENSSLRFISAGLCSAPFRRDDINVVTWTRQRPDQGGITYYEHSEKKYLRGGSAYEIFESDIAINSRDERLAGGVETYLQTVLPFVLTHEIGHFIGLDHSNVSCSVMIPRSLNPICADDIAAAEFLYP